MKKFDLKKLKNIDYKKLATFGTASPTANAVWAICTAIRPACTSIVNGAV